VARHQAPELVLGREIHELGKHGAAGVHEEKVSVTKDTYYFVSATNGPADFISRFRRFYGPTMNAFDAAEQSGKAEELHSQLLDLAKAHTKSTNDGTLFRKSPGFRGTVLLRDPEDPRHFLTIDSWDKLDA